jgi:hypothetical protein
MQVPMIEVALKAAAEQLAGRSANQHSMQRLGSRSENAAPQGAVLLPR